MTEQLGELRESETSYGKIWNENGKSYYQAYDYPVVEVTQQNLDDVANGAAHIDRTTIAYGSITEVHKFDGAKTVGGIIWSWGPNDKFVRYLKATGQLVEGEEE